MYSLRRLSKQKTREKNKVEAKREQEQREEQGEMTCEEITAKRREQRHERGYSCVKGYGKGINTIKGKDRRQTK